MPSQLATVHSDDTQDFIRHPNPSDRAFTHHLTTPEILCSPFAIHCIADEAFEKRQQGREFYDRSCKARLV